MMDKAGKIQVLVTFPPPLGCHMCY